MNDRDSAQPLKPQPKVRRNSSEERARERKALARVFPSMGLEEEPAILAAMGKAARRLEGKTIGKLVASLVNEKDPARRREDFVRALIDLAARRPR